MSYHKGIWEAVNSIEPSEADGEIDLSSRGIDWDFAQDLLSWSAAIDEGCRLTFASFTESKEANGTQLLETA